MSATVSTRARLVCLTGMLALAVGLLAAAAAPATAYETRAVRSVYGTGSFERLGQVAAAIGDFNGDGVPDFAAGVPLAQSVRVYFGGRSGAGADFTIPSTDASFGSTVAPAGDFNGDGFADLAVGAPNFAGPAGAGSGRVRIYFGGPAADGMADVVLDGLAAGERFGAVIAGGGDLDGDGYDDLLTAALPGTGAHQVRVFRGGTAPSTEPALQISGNATDRLGIALAIAGDLDLDGFDDFLVGVSTPGDSGRVWLLRGGPVLDATPVRTWTGSAASSHLGENLGAAGDFNADGYPDLFMTEVGWKRVFIYAGGVDPGAALLAELPGDRGTAAGDLNLDGVDDFVTRSGWGAEIFFGASSPDGTPDVPVIGELTLGFGTTLDRLGDASGDGVPEFIVGAPGISSPTYNTNGRIQAVQITRLEVLAPAGKPDWVAGVRQTASWQGAGPIDIRYSPDSARTWTVLAEGVGGPGGGSAEIRIPGPAVDEGWLEFVVPGVAETPLTVRRAPIRVVEVRMTALPAGTEWYPGVRPTLSWIGLPLVDLEAKRPDGEWRTLAAGVGGAETNQRAVDLPLDLFGWLSLRVRTSGAPVTPLNHSELPGQVPLHAFRVDVPAANEVWHAGDSVSVHWLGGTLADVELRLTATQGTTVPLAEGAGGAASNTLFLVAPALEGPAEITLRARGVPGEPLGNATSPRFNLCFDPRLSRLETEVLSAGNGVGTAPHLGRVVTDAGDLNGDGFIDFCVSAPDGGPTGGGEVDVYFGGASGPTGPLVLQSARSDERFGTAVAGVGDLNGDGYDDLVVTAPGYASFSNWGRANVYLGGATMDAVADRSFYSPSASFAYGNVISRIGDYNGDGYQDFAVATVTSGSASTSWLQVYLGAADLQTMATIDMSPTGRLYGFGSALAPVGDWDGDGLDDLAVGVPLSTGSVEIRGYPNRLVATFTSSVPNRRFGEGIALLRQQNRARDLLAVAMPGAVATGGLYGEVVLLGRGGVEKARLHGTPLVQMGTALDASADLDGDGLDDLLVGAPGNVYQKGEAYVWSGASIETACRSMTALLQADRPGSGFGSSVALVPRADGALAAVLVGAPTYADAGSTPGRYELHRVVRPRFTMRPPGRIFYPGELDTISWSGSHAVDVAFSPDDGASWSPLFEGIAGARAWTIPKQTAMRARLRVSKAGERPVPANGDVSPAFRIAERVPEHRVAHRARPILEGTAAHERAGTTVGWLKDVDGDGLPEAIAAAPDAEGGTGRVTVHLSGGGTRTWRGEASGDRFGAAVLGTHDLAGAGKAALVVGAPGHGDQGAGRVYLFDDALQDTPARVYDGAAGEAFGAALCAVEGTLPAGVLLAVGAPGAGNGNGVVRLYARFSAPGSPQVVLPGPAGGGGWSAALGAADLNGDGVMDLVVGAPQANTPKEGAGRVSVYVAPFSGSAKPWLEFAGTVEHEGMGGALAGGTDLDGDGFDDLAIGSPGRTGTRVDEGRVTLLFGGPHLDPGSSRVIDGGVAGGRFGTAVAMPGDVDGDGVADLVVGAPFAGTADAGVVRVYRGAPRFEREVAFELQGAPGDRFGSALSGLSDPRVAGLHDLIVGAPYANGAAVDAGRVDLIDMERYFVVRPNGGEVWQAGTVQTVEWLGEEPAEVELSLDGGRTWRPFAQSEVRTHVMVRVPGEPTSQARVRVIAADRSQAGSDASDADFEIRTAVRLKRFTAEARADGVHLEWETDPGPGPEGIRGYRVMRVGRDGREETLHASAQVTTETSYVDTDAAPGDAYTLSALDGLGRWIELGRLGTGRIEGLRVGPIPWRGTPALHIAFEAPAGTAGYTAADLEVAVYDATGRLAAVLARGSLEARAGIVELTWNGRRHDGSRAAPGVYFLRAAAPTAGFSLTRRLVIVR